MLHAAPSHSGKLHSVASHVIRRDVELLDMSDMMNIHTTFAEVAAHRHVSRLASLKQFLHALSPCDGSPLSSSDTHAEDSSFCHAPDTAIGSLCTLGDLYGQREMRWIEEKHRLDNDKEKVLLLLRQVLDIGVVGDLVETAQ